jgi:hypothetical protein
MQIAEVWSNVVQNQTWYKVRKKDFRWRQLGKKKEHEALLAVLYSEEYPNSAGHVW